MSRRVAGGITGMTLFPCLRQAVDYAGADAAFQALEMMYTHSRHRFAIWGRDIYDQVCRITLADAAEPRARVRLVMRVGVWCGAGTPLLPSSAGGDEVLCMAFLCGILFHQCDDSADARLALDGHTQARRAAYPRVAAALTAARCDAEERQCAVRVLFRALMREIGRELARLSWGRVRAAVRVRPYAMHWLGEAAKAACAPGGAGRAEDLRAFETDFGEGASALGVCGGLVAHEAEHGDTALDARRARGGEGAGHDGTGGGGEDRVQL